ncbi:hypothetical protein EHQ92_16810 [Leptospira biflexa]|jgi:hypothetical protein|uniref:Uncharacterized protein n=1 Tax=Leptospira biflexa serovar Patoc (strain Patoc 1 / ATCC 23582 / Paris) TaxID=456481 RepID=B0SMQ8_LEPBP|nr:hypothetical protein [Leptospira biflexa]ABZ98782.1 Hypothetical protein LEPBI_I2704 [Leptospira biflexa serovar Patoc strain 'Patoc 1 (Paris)']TGM33715.1 hypothetical protein EHQ80_15840 [Leptospira biflexa]TGM35419.1 hypothetical protein EHQ89_10885 [Leptospira biflexa]TGM42448.1 hypothetical protein EHQ92_16810 [Leptospira biflexa]TGM44334.1 hypothetical protein EHQ88_17145 [Leptospira biflexa]
MSRLSNGWKVPESLSDKKELLDSYQKTVNSMESENPLTIFREHMDNGLLFKAGLQDAMNQLTTFANLYMSIIELKEEISKQTKGDSN